MLSLQWMGTFPFWKSRWKFLRVAANSSALCLSAAPDEDDGSAEEDAEAAKSAIDSASETAV